MIDNMFTVMKRINEIRSRFGIGRHRPASLPAEGGARNAYRDMHDRAVASDRGVKGIEGKTVEEIRKLADHYALANRVSPELVRAVIETESNYNPRAVSPKGAKGLMQLMPSVINDLGVKDPFNPGENISAGVTMLKDLLVEYDGDYKKALSAYNAGRRAVNESGGVPDFPETQEYVKKVIDAYVKNSE
ncbi:MAG: lytic transglycosylase domain-containing protein [Spirochaetes bacterium]|nr:lytic transglycosylase domain-containing protein [Spirochaetota bacterium]